MEEPRLIPDPETSAWGCLSENEARICRIALESSTVFPGIFSDTITKIRHKLPPGDQIKTEE